MDCLHAFAKRAFAKRAIGLMWCGERPNPGPATVLRLASLACRALV
jgi:hypothetical protein